MRQHWLTFLPALTLAALLISPGAQPAAAADAVVGDGSAASCTEAALVTAVAGGGAITFDCGTAPVTIPIASPLRIEAPSVTIDGGGTITLQGAGGRIIEHRTFGTIGSSTLTLRGLTLVGGRASGSGASADEANGAAVRSVFQAADPSFKPTLVVAGVTFRDNVSALSAVPAGGNAYDYGGGAIYSLGGTVVVRDSSFVDNRADNGSGGAIHILQSSLTVERSTFDGNSTIGARPEDSLGGAIYIDGLGSDSRLFRVAASSFVDNQAYNSGGAIYVNMYEDVSRTEVVDSLFEGNAVTGGTRAQGGAIGGGGTSLGRDGTGNPSISISGSLFAGNSVGKTPGAGGNTTEDGSGGALAFPQRTRLRIVNSTFSGNTAKGSGFNANGGALYVVNNTDQFTIEGSTFAGNRAGWVGGAISNSSIGDGPGGRVRATIFANNTADNGPNDWNIQQHCSSELAHDGTSLQYPPRLTGGNFFNDVTCFQGKSDPGLTSDPLFRDPQLAALADNGGPTRTHAIPAGSPALNAVGESCPATDQRGVRRPQGSACDIGAFERSSALVADVTLLPVGTALRTVTLRGDGFTAASAAHIDGQDRPTTFVNSATLRLTLADADVDSAGRRTISVVGPGSELGTATIVVSSNTQQLYLPLLNR